MKITLCSTVTAVLISITSICESQDLSSLTVSGVNNTLSVAAQSPYVVSARDLHSRVWTRVTWLANATGQQTAKTNSYTEIATGLEHYSAGALADSSGEMSVTAIGAQATNALHQLYLLGNINSPDPTAVQVVLPDGRHIASKPLGLAYFDYSSQQSIWIGEITDSYGQLLPTKTQGIYPDAFSGGIVADVLYENAPAGYEQSVVIRSQLPSPSEWNLNPDTTVLQIITEFTNFPPPQVTTSAAVPLGDDTVDFGSMRLGQSAAFALGDEGNRIPGTKRWVILDGRQCLIEQIPYPAISDLLQSLPPPSPGHARIGSPDSILHRVLARQTLPRRKSTSGEPAAFTLAQAPLAGKGLVADYQLLTSQGTLTLQGDTTYYVSGTVNVTNLTIEGGSVIKYTNQTTAEISVSGSIACKTAPYRMAVFTSKDDNSVGEKINGSSGAPTNYLGGTFLYITCSNTLSYLRLSYARTGIWQENTSLNPVWNCQFFKCGWAFYDNPNSSYTVQQLHNVLFSQCSYAVYDPSSYTTCMSVIGEQVTADQLSYFLKVPLCSGAQATLTNSILTGIATPGTLSLYNCCQLSTNTGVFQTVGGGNYYLAANSTNRNAGLMTINPTLLSTLRQKTTYPPVYLIGRPLATTNVVLTQEAARDTNATSVDLGWHYDPLDYEMGFVFVTNAISVSVSAGTAIGMFVLTTIS